MHRMNDPMPMDNDTVFISCGCGWWGEAEYDEIEVSQNRAINIARGLWVKHMKEIKVRFDGRMT
jgi:uncharacterized protein (DUF427 family)